MEVRPPRATRVACAANGAAVKAHATRGRSPRPAAVIATDTLRPPDATPSPSQARSTAVVASRNTARQSGEESSKF